MPYVNERISDEDMLKYRIDEMAWGYQSNHHRYWVIDRDKDVYLREASEDRESLDNKFWSFYWRGYQWPVYGFVVDFEPRKPDGKSKLLIRIDFRKCPEDLISQLEEARNHFKNAFCSHPWHLNSEVTFIFE